MHRRAIDIAYKFPNAQQHLLYKSYPRDINNKRYMKTVEHNSAVKEDWGIMRET